MEFLTVLSGPLHINIDITNQCNLLCKHCFNRSGADLHRKEMLDEEFMEIIGQVIEMRPYSVCLCGGEPLMRKKLLFEAIRLLKLNDIEVGIVTNGILLTSENAMILKHLGVNSLQISIDGMESTHDFIRNSKGVFKKALLGIDAASQAQIEVNVAFCATSVNSDDFLKIVHFLKERFSNVKYIRMQPLVLMGRAYSELQISDSGLNRLVEFANTYNRRYGKTIILEDPIDTILRQYLSPIAQTPVLDINSEGLLLLSTYIPYVIGDLKKKRLIDFWREGIGAAWRKNEVRKIIENISSVDTFAIYL